MEREAIFEIADSLMLVTNMTWSCYTMWEIAEYTIETTVKNNLFNPVLILVNCFMEFFYIISALVAEFANFNYMDWFSFAYWVGDLLYRIIIVDHSDEAETFLTNVVQKS